MTNRSNYDPGPASGASVEKIDGTWTLVLVRELKHKPETVWAALTDPDQLREWAPYDADTNLGVTGAEVKLTTVGAPSEHITETTITRAEPPRLLEFNWGGGNLRWQLEPHAGGTRLTLWAVIPPAYIVMGAAGWHLCLDVMDHYLADDPVGRIVGQDAMQFPGWQRLHEEYREWIGQ